MTCFEDSLVVERVDPDAMTKLLDGSRRDSEDEDEELEGERRRPFAGLIGERCTVIRA